MPVLLKETKQKRGPGELLGSVVSDKLSNFIQDENIINSELDTSTTKNLEYIDGTGSRGY